MVSSDQRMLIRERWISSKVVKIFEFGILSDWIEKYKSALKKSDSSWDNSYCVRLVIVLLSVNIDKMQSLVSANRFFCWVYNDSCSDLLLNDIVNFKYVEVNSRKLFR